MLNNNLISLKNTIVKIILTNNNSFKKKCIKTVIMNL